MYTGKPTSGNRHSLQAVGISELDERVYHELLERPGATLEELGRASGLTPARLRSRLQSLEELGFVSRSPGKPSRLVPAAPDVAVEVLVLKKREELERARLEAAKLAESFRVGMERSRPIELVEIVRGQKAYAQRFKQLQQAARQEVLVLDKPPYASPLPEQIQVELERIQQGVRYRAIYDSTSLEMPGQLEVLERLVKAGEEARTLASLPLKLSIADSKLALIPLHGDGDGSEARDAVLLHSSPLLGALTVLFEMFWAGATPIQFRTGSQSERPRAVEDERLLVLLAAGLMDQAIAQQLGVALRTVERRVRRLMDALGAQTRFQAGVQAAVRGLVGTTGKRDQR